MSEVVTLQLPDQLARNAREVAAYTHRPLEDVLVEWLDRVAANPPVESLPDEQVLALCDLQMDPDQQTELSSLLARNQEGALSRTEQTQLDDLMRVYRRGMVRKAQALNISVERGLRPPLN